jgi:hypothetical protein
MNSLDLYAYLDDMRKLVDVAIATWKHTKNSDPIFTVSIWTDPDACVSAISIDTRSNSERCLKEANEWSKQHYDRLMAAGETAEAELFLPAVGRAWNPADFEFSELESAEHTCFPRNWAEISDGTCWEQLEPALADVAQYAIARFADLNTEKGAVLGINSHRDWIDKTWELSIHG